MEEGVAPTDSRYRPDQRLMEEGKWNEANEEKVFKFNNYNFHKVCLRYIYYVLFLQLRLEEKQRCKRRRREAEAEEAAARKEPHPPTSQIVWFTRQSVPAGVTGTTTHVYNGDYWLCKERQDWSRCPDIY